MIQDCVADHRVVSLLIQIKLSSVTKLRIGLAILVDIRYRRKRPRASEEVNDGTLSNVEENTDVLLASRKPLDEFVVIRRLNNVPSHVLLGSSESSRFSVRGICALATGSLAAEQGSAKQAQYRIC